MAPVAAGRRTVLVVSDDPGLAHQMGGWLEAAGVEVLECPGPRQDHPLCVGLQTHHCPLTAAADLVIVDMRPSDRDLVDDSARKDLPARYQEAGRSVIALVEGAGWSQQQGINGTSVLNRFAGRGELLEAVSDLMPAGRVPRLESAASAVGAPLGSASTRS